MNAKQTADELSPETSRTSELLAIGPLELPRFSLHNSGSVQFAEDTHLLRLWPASFRFVLGPLLTLVVFTSTLEVKRSSPYGPLILSGRTATIVFVHCTTCRSSRTATDANDDRTVPPHDRSVCCRRLSLRRGLARSTGNESTAAEPGPFITIEASVSCLCRLRGIVSVAAAAIHF